MVIMIIFFLMKVHYVLYSETHTSFWVHSFLPRVFGLIESNQNNIRERKGGMGGEENKSGKRGRWRGWERNGEEWGEGKSKRVGRERTIIQNNYMYYIIFCIPWLVSMILLTVSQSSLSVFVPLVVSPQMFLF